jgi:hypothetical protein
MGQATLTIFQKKPVVFIFTQMGFQKASYHIEDIPLFFARHSLNQRPGKCVIGYLLQVVNQGVFIGRAIHSKSDEPLEGFDKTMGVFRHVWYSSFPIERGTLYLYAAERDDHHKAPEGDGQCLSGAGSASVVFYQM